MLSFSNFNEVIFQENPNFGLRGEKPHFQQKTYFPFKIQGEWSFFKLFYEILLQFMI